MRLFRTPIKTMRFVLAIALALWCAGAGCMLVSYAHSAAMSAGGASSCRLCTEFERNVVLDGRAQLLQSAPCIVKA